MRPEQGKEPWNDADAELLAGLALGLLAEAEEPAGDAAAARSIWRRFERERAPRRTNEARLRRWLAGFQLVIGAGALAAMALGWVVLGGLERWLQAPGAAEVHKSPVLAVALISIALLATGLGLTFSRWLEG